MIKKYNQYIKETKFNEELNFRNLFRKNKEYKPNEVPIEMSNEVPIDTSSPDYIRNILDPYGEEDWETDELTPVLQKARKQGKPFDEIIELNCPYMNLKNLDGIENLHNLKELWCSNNQLTSLKEIENLYNLEQLYCYNNKLTNLKGIEYLYNLKELYCSRNKLNSLKEIRNLHNLETLWSYSTELTNLDGIEDLRNLKKFYCQHNRFSYEYGKYIREWAREKNIKLYI